jgi:hypothetical protein
MIETEFFLDGLDNGCNKQAQPSDTLDCDDARDLPCWLDVLVSLFHFTKMPLRKSGLDGRHCSEDCNKIAGYPYLLMISKSHWYVLKDIDSPLSQRRRDWRQSKP